MLRSNNIYTFTKVLWMKLRLYESVWRFMEETGRYLDDKNRSKWCPTRSSEHPAWKIRRQSYPKPPWESSIHWCGTEDLERLRGTSICMLHQAYSNTFLCQHNELDLSLHPLWVWRVFWSVATSLCPPSTGDSLKEREGPLEEPFRMQRRGLRWCSECSEGYWAACSEGDW